MVGSVIDKLALRQFFVRVFKFFPVIPPLIHMDSCAMWGWRVGPLASTVPHPIITKTVSGGLNIRLMLPENYEIRHFIECLKSVGKV